MIDQKAWEFDAGFLHALGIAETEPFPVNDDSLIHNLENELTKAGEKLDRANYRAQQWEARAIARKDVIVIGSMLFSLVCFLVWVTRP